MESERARFSVCMATYNGMPYVIEQVSSIVSQLSENDELLISDDGSSDLTVEELRKLWPWIRVISRSRVGGVVKNFERVLQASTGHYVVMCDQDDVWLPGRLATFEKHLSSSSLIVLDAYIVDKNLSRIVNESLLQYLNAGPGFLANLYKNGFVGCCMAFKSELLVDALPFPRNIEMHDWYIGLVASCFYSVKFVREPSLLFRRHELNSSSTTLGSNNSLLFKARIRIRIVCALFLVLRRKLLKQLLLRPKNHRP